MSDLVLQKAPPPLAALRREILHPDNIALEARIKRARLLSMRGVLRMRAQRAFLALKLQRVGYRPLRDEIRRYRALQMILSEAKTRAQEILALMPPNPALFHVRSYFSVLEVANRASLEIVDARLEQLQNRCSAIAPTVQELQRLDRMLQAYAIAKLRKHTEDELFRQLSEEARIYSHYIKTTWSHLPGCHHRYADSRGKTIVEVPQFARCDITPDAIYYKILASFKAMFGWRPGLPYGVYVDALINERTLANISVACQRQVTAITTHHGVWLVVHRLNTTDGLMDHLRYTQVMEYYPDEHTDALPVCVGVGYNRTLKWLNFRDFPHWLVAGYTGGGKSNLVNVIICTLITHHTPNEVRLVLVDLKGGLEFSHYEGLPHLALPIVQTPSEVVHTIAQIEGEMERRFALMSSYRAKRIDYYNSRVPQGQRLPRIVLFFDEFASLAAQGEITKRVDNSIMQLVNRGRAVGIHVVISTQDPRTEVLRGAIKTNLNVRITGRMPTSSASMTVLGRGDAAELAPIPGRMLLMISPEPEQIQTPHISDDDISQALLRASEHPTTPLELPEARQHQEWTPERVIELAIKHLSGAVTFSRVYKSIDDITQSQARELCESIWRMEQIVYDGVEYKIEKRRGGARYLVATGGGDDE